MADYVAIKVIQDDSHAAGHVVLRVSGVERAPLDETFVIRRVGDQATTFDADWPAGPRTPLASQWHQERRELDLLVGPDVVNPIPGGTAVSIHLPGLGNHEIFVTWPGGLMLAVSRNPRRGQTRKSVAVPVVGSDDAPRRASSESPRADQERERAAQQLAQRQAAEERERREAAERQRVEQEQRQATERQRVEQERRDVERQQHEAQLARTRQEAAAQASAPSDDARPAAAATEAPVSPPRGDRAAPAPRRRNGRLVGIALAATVVVTAVVIWLAMPRQAPGSGAPLTPVEKQPGSDAPVSAPPSTPCGDPDKDYELAMEKFFTSPSAAERLLGCVIRGADEQLADKARRQLKTLEQRKKQ